MVHRGFSWNSCMGLQLHGVNYKVTILDAPAW